jgi:hypothetical protein
MFRPLGHRFRRDQCPAARGTPPHGRPRPADRCRPRGVDSPPRRSPVTSCSGPAAQRSRHHRSSRVHGPDAIRGTPSASVVKPAQSSAYPGRIARGQSSPITLVPSAAIGPWRGLCSGAMR